MAATLALDHSSSLASSLAVLQKTDAAVVAVVARASHVAVFVHDSATKAWVRVRRCPRPRPRLRPIRPRLLLPRTQQKRNVEGALFLVAR